MRKLFSVLAIIGITLSGCGVDWFPAASTTSGGAVVAAFTLAAKAGVAPGSVVTSDAITVTLTSGTTAAISVSGATGSEFSIDNGTTWTSTAGTVSNGASVKVRHTASSTLGQSVTTKLTIGSQTADFTSTVFTASVNAFTFRAISSARLSTTQTSQPVTVQVTAGSAPNISISGDSTSKYSVNGGAYKNTAGTVANGDVVTVQHTSSSDVGGTVSSILAIGDKTATFTSKTVRFKPFAATASGTAGTDVFTPQPITFVPGTHTIQVTAGDGFVSFDGTTTFLSGDAPAEVTLTAATTDILLDALAPTTLTIVIDGVESTYTVTAQ